jgi:triosephosphate isomerase
MNRKYRKTIVAGNWKMNMLASQVRPFSESLYGAIGHEKSCEIVLCVPALMIPALASVRIRRLGIGAQNVSEFEKGAHTGEVSAD